jgi:acid phosphatase type 7
VNTRLALVAAFASLLAATSDVSPVAPEDLPPVQRTLPSGLEARYVVGVAGDIACESDPNGPSSPETCQYDDTSDLIHRTGLTEVLTLGDNQYEQGEFRAYQRFFDPTWGRALANISPAPGNHEYPNGPSSRPRGYFRYFGDRVKGPHRLGYYSFDTGACPDDPCWHVISLNSELCHAPGGCGRAADPNDPGPGNRMHKWLTRDLADHPDGEYPCTLAYWHHPLFSFSSGSGPSAAVRPLWQLLYDAGADVVLVGHSHNYQRWKPQHPSGTLDRDRGIRQFVVGTGGRSLYALPGGDMPRNLVVAQADSFGVLEIALRADSYRWEWVTAVGQPVFEDSSAREVACVRLTA